MRLLGDSISTEGVGQDGKKLIMHKDLSDTGISSAANLLQAGLQNADDHATLACGNEGRLRRLYL